MAALIVIVLIVDLVLTTIVYCKFTSIIGLYQYDMDGIYEDIENIYGDIDRLNEDTEYTDGWIHNIHDELGNHEDWIRNIRWELDNYTTTSNSSPNDDALTTPVKGQEVAGLISSSKKSKKSKKSNCEKV